MAGAVGENLERVDGYGKVTGKAAYTGDLNIPGMIHGKVLRSPHAHARVSKIDGSKAEQIPGVMAVLTRENCQVATPYIGAMIKDQCLVAFDKVRYAGDIVAAVAATDENIAENALDAIEVEYEELPAITTVEEALADNAPLIHETVRRARPPQYGRGASYILHEKSNICHHFRYERGDVGAGFKAADFVFEDTFYFPSAHHYPMESNVSVADFNKDGVTIWASTQGPFGLRQEVARVFGLPLSDIRVIVPYVGGGYGGAKGLVPSIIGVALSRLARRPVRVNFSAEENFKTICQPRAKITMKSGIKKDGTFIARRCQLFLNAGAYVNSTPSVAEKAGYRGHGPYRLPHVLTDSYAVYTNTVPTGSFRGFGGPQVAFSYESHVDMIAQRMKLDPVDLRRKNLLTKGEDFAAGDTPTDCDLKGALAKVAEAIGWGAEDTPAKPGVKRGKGLACALKDGGGTKKASHANVKILNDGSLVVFSGSVEIGQGVQTVMRQIVAEEFAVPGDQVRVDEIDTRYTPFDTATNASSASALMGSAVFNAAAVWAASPGCAAPPPTSRSPVRMAAAAARSPSYASWRSSPTRSVMARTMGPVAVGRMRSFMPRSARRAAATRPPSRRATSVRWAPTSAMMRGPGAAPAPMAAARTVAMGSTWDGAKTSVSSHPGTTINATPQDSSTSSSRPPGAGFPRT